MNIEKKYDTKCPRWEDFIKLVAAANVTRSIKEHIAPSLYYTDNAMTLPNARRIGTTLGASAAEAHVNVPIAGNGAEPRKHDVDVYYWQCLGNIEIKTLQQTFFLEPGDLLHIPKGTNYKEVPTSPRAGILFYI